MSIPWSPLRSGGGDQDRGAWTATLSISYARYHNSSQYENISKSWKRKPSTPTSVSICTPSTLVSPLSVPRTRTPRALHPLRRRVHPQERPQLLDRNGQVLRHLPLRSLLQPDLLKVE